MAKAKAKTNGVKANDPIHQANVRSNDIAAALCDQFSVNKVKIESTDSGFEVTTLRLKKAPKTLEKVERKLDLVAKGGEFVLHENDSRRNRDFGWREYELIPEDQIYTKDEDKVVKKTGVVLVTLKGTAEKPRIQVEAAPWAAAA